jgi:quercetin dioxygenase-like cupin family protein
MSRSHTVLAAALVIAACSKTGATSAASASVAPAGAPAQQGIQWGPAPAVFPRGAEFAVLEGDPSKAEPFTVRLRFPNGYKIPPHTHTQSENLTVLSGALYLGYGDKTDMAKAHALRTGGYHYLPGKTPHYAYTKTATTLQVSGEGPFDINYLDPKDNPEKKAWNP